MQKYRYYGPIKRVAVDNPTEICFHDEHVLNEYVQNSFHEQ